ncbi:flagellar filament capping protein FliD [Nocardioides sp.]|uniref:flagellar filament capping protein FliD n=1 Tax=Nocardioides sp. TaxID=35761 RepID=UPI002ED8CBD8
MATSSISGLASGLDTASLVDQLMQLEAIPQTRLKTQQTTEKSVLSALRSLNTDTLLLASKATALAKPATWQTLKATVTGTGVTATAGATAAATTLSFTIGSVAASHQLGFTNAAALTDVVASGSSVTITGSDGVAHDVSTGGGTLSELVSSINASSSTTGVRASAVKVADGSYRLLAESTTTGAASSFTLTNADGTDLLGGASVRAGADASIDLGLGITATSSTNTFTNLVPGVDVTLAPTATVGGTATVTVAQDSSSVRASVKGLVDQVNSLLSLIDTQTATKTETGTAGVLAGDTMSRSLRNSLVNTIFGSDSTSMASLGIQTDRYGKLVFDGDAFDKAYAADPSGVAAKFTTGATTATDGWAARVAAVAKGATGVNGTITAAIAGRNTALDRLTDSIADWDDRLEIRRKTLERTYTALETALSNMQSQGNWLAGQISSLPTYSS